MSDGQSLSDPVKREAGERPERSRRCDRGAVFPASFEKREAVMSLISCQKKRHDRELGRRNAVLILQSEDLPVVSTV